MKLAEWGLYDEGWSNGRTIGEGELPAFRGVVGATSQTGLICLWSSDGPLIPPMSLKRSVNLSIKRVIDVLVALFALFFLSPLLLCIALAIKATSRGPVLFRQTRIGLNNKHFSVLKFRSMYADQADPSGTIQTIAGDPRVTPIGRFLRRTSMDELPQLVNVLCGDLSLVGPRPHVPGQLANEQPYQEFVAYYSLRHEMRPGLTGWAQANGYRGSTADPVLARGRVDHDMAYIQNFSVLLDLRIMLLTLRREFLTGSGY